MSKDIILVDNENYYSESYVLKLIQSASKTAAEEAIKLLKAQEA